GDKLAVGSELLRVEVEEGGAKDAKPAAPVTMPAAAPVVAAIAPAAARAPTAETTTPEVVGKPLASPSVRRHARELSVDLKQVRGTGPDGRIVHDDVVAFAARGGKPPSVARYAQREGQKEVAVIGLRRQIALRMQDSLRVPHFTYVEEIDVTELEALRARLNADRAATRGRLTVLPFLMR